MQRLFNRVVPLLFTLLVVSLSHAQTLKLPMIFSDHMVLQRDVEVPIWGWGKPGYVVTIRFNDQRVSATTMADGKWHALLKPLEASAEPAELTVSSEGRTLTVSDVLVGDVWLCSGQSNMEWNVANSNNAQEEIADANHPLIRQIKPERNPQMLVQDEFKAAEWTVCTPENVGDWTAVGYFFGRHLQQELDIPIGLLNCSWGGTRIEPWAPRIGFKEVPETQDIYENTLVKDPTSEPYHDIASSYLDEARDWLQNSRQKLGKQQALNEPPSFPDRIKPYTNHQDPTMLYNGMVAPLVPFAIKGSIWYQGESNRFDGMLYLHKTRALIDGWRSVWSIPDLPYYYVQIAPFQYGNEPRDILPKFWLAQAEIEKQIPNTGMVVVSDIGNLTDIHPRNKQDAGRRLANMALAKTYGRQGIVYHGPVYKSHQVQGDKFLITFDEVGSGLAARDDQPLTTFEIGSLDKAWTPADAKIISNDTVEVSAEGVTSPVVARFAFDKLATPNLMNQEGLPAQTFIAGEIPHWDSLKMNVSESEDYELVYDIDLSTIGHEITYAVDRSAEVGPFDRVAYFLELVDHDGKQEWVYVSMDAFTDDAAKIGIPAIGSGISFQQAVHNVNTVNNDGVVPTIEGREGFIEFWPNNYGPQNAADVRGASGGIYDFGDQINDPADGYGSMQVHQIDEKVTVFALNHWREGNNADLGIGNAPGQNKDWTFSQSAKDYAKKRLRILVRPATEQTDATPETNNTAEAANTTGTTNTSETGVTR